MRYGLLSTVAAAALSLSVAGVVAQTSGSTTSGGTSTSGTSGTSTQPAPIPNTSGTSTTGGSAQGTTSGQSTTGTAQTGGQTGGTQQPTATGSVNISTENRTEVTRVFRSVRTEPVSVNFNVAVGSTVPTTVTTLHSCPSDVVRLINGLPECRYIVVQDKIVLIEPSSRRIVMVIDRQG